MTLLRTKGSKKAVDKKLVAFSFDDGPNAENILDILNILNKANAQATFFWIVENAKKLKNDNPNLFKRLLNLISDGHHEIGLHAPYDYKPTLLTRVYGKFNKKELAEAKRDLENLTSQGIRLYRPHILLQPATIFYARQLGLTTVIGNIAKYYADSAAKIGKQVAKFSLTKAGSILIFHDGISMYRHSTYITKVLPQVISNLKKRGLRPVKVSDVL